MEGATTLQDCSIAASLTFVGDRWTLLILRDAFRGVRRFGDFCADLGIARNILTDRLEKLVDAGIFVKVPYQERPLRHEYRLTDKGRDLFPHALMLMQWGDRWLAPGSGPNLRVSHKPCGTQLGALVTCSHCHAAIDPHDVTFPPSASRKLKTETA